MYASPGATLYSVSLKKPLGIVFEERGADVVVAEVVPGGSADLGRIPGRMGSESLEGGRVAVGDVLRGTSAVPLRESQSPVPMVGFMATRGESWRTVMAAIASNTCRNCPVVLVLERPARGAAAAGGAEGMNTTG